MQKEVHVACQDIITMTAGYIKEEKRRGQPRDGLGGGGRCILYSPPPSLTPSPSLPLPPPPFLLLFLSARTLRVPERLSNPTPRAPHSACRLSYNMIMRGAGGQRDPSIINSTLNKGQVVISVGGGRTGKGS